MTRRQRRSARIRTLRGPVAAAAAALALTVVAGCSAGTSMIGAQPAPPSAAFGQTASPQPPAPPQNCDVNGASAAPNPASAGGPDVSRIKAAGHLTVGVAADEYLTGYLGSDDTEQGFDIDLAHAIAKSLFGNPNAVQFVAISTANRIPDLQAKTHPVDMVIDTFTITCDRLNQADFSAVYYNASQRLLVEKGSGYQSLADLGGQNVCAQTGSTSIQLIQSAPSHPHAIAVTDITDCLVLLEENRVAAISTDDTILAGLARQDPNLQVVGPDLAPQPYGIGMPLGETDLEQYVNGVLAQYESSGGWNASYGQWLAPSLGAVNPPVARYSD